MLITRSTPRITYRIGIRAGFGVPADKLLPSLIADAEDEVAAFKGILKILTGSGCRLDEKLRQRRYESTLRNGTGAGFRETRKGRSLNFEPRNVNFAYASS